MRLGPTYRRHDRSELPREPDGHDAAIAVAALIDAGERASERALGPRRHREDVEEPRRHRGRLLLDRHRPAALRNGDRLLASADEFKNVDEGACIEKLPFPNILAFSLRWAGLLSGA